MRFSPESTLHGFNILIPGFSRTVKKQKKTQSLALQSQPGASLRNVPQGQQSGPSPSSLYSPTFKDFHTV